MQRSGAMRRRKFTKVVKSAAVGMSTWGHLDEARGVIRVWQPGQRTRPAAIVNVASALAVAELLRGLHRTATEPDTGPCVVVEVTPSARRQRAPQGRL